MQVRADLAIRAASAHPASFQGVEIEGTGLLSRVSHVIRTLMVLGAWCTGYSTPEGDLARRAVYLNSLVSPRTVFARWTGCAIGLAQTSIGTCGTRDHRVEAALRVWTHVAS
jgi:hypothetical protein